MDYQSKNSAMSAEQEALCSKYRVDGLGAPGDLKGGVARNVREGIEPINGLRHFPEGDTTGWYIWAGEDYSEDPDFFLPLHVSHLHEWCPEVMKFLALPPGWRFLKAGEYEDVWYDPDLLAV